MCKYLLAMFIATSSLAHSAEDAGIPTDPEVAQQCLLAADNVILAYKQAQANVPLTKLLRSYPDYQPEILIGYKLFGEGNTEYQTYQIFRAWCLDNLKRS